jgi:hypothetical protein
VGKLTGFLVGSTVGDIDGSLALGVDGVTSDCFVGSGESAGGMELVVVGGPVFPIDDSGKLGVMVGTGVNRWYAMTVDRAAISSAPGS